MPNADRFVNPYNFVPLPSEVLRREPVGHDQVTDSDGAPLYFGHIEIEWKLHAPLLLPANAKEEGWIRGDGSLRIPGASIKGALRSLHETMFAGCLRVVDEDFVPGYRDAAVGEGDAAENEWTLGLVSRSLAGTPVEVIPCKRTEWVDALSLLAAYGDNSPGSLPRSGDLLDLDGSPEQGALGRWEICDVDRVAAVERAAVVTDEAGFKIVLDSHTPKRVVLVTDTSARKEVSRGKRARCFWATAELTDTRLPVSDLAASRFRQACAGSEDRRLLTSIRAQRNVDDRWRSQSLSSPVKWWKSMDGPCERGDFSRLAGDVGSRTQATGLLHAGDVVWIKQEIDDEGDTVVGGIKLSQLWRHVGEHAVRTRIPPSVKPCRHPYAYPEDNLDEDDGVKHGLCLSCSVFGSVDAAGADAGQGRQDAYAGRVRFGSATSKGPVTLRIVSGLASMGAPHAGAGMFYLNGADLPESRPQGDLPSNWGSYIDRPRGLRGRKYYWHSDPDEQAQHWTDRNGMKMQPRYVAQTDNQRRRARPADLVPKGTVFGQRLAVNGLDDLAIRSLLAAIDPSRMLAFIPGAAGRTFAVHLGGGKPLGLGTALAINIKIDLQTAGNRYRLTPEEPRTDGWTIVDGHVRALTKRVGRFTQHLGRLARMLDIEGPGDEWSSNVSYPPGTTWAEVGTNAFGESYKFFAKYDGEQLAENAHDWKPLPTLPKELTETFDPSLPVATAGQAQARAQQGGRDKQGRNRPHQGGQWQQRQQPPRKGGRR